MAPISGQYTALALHMAQDNIFLVSCPLFQKKMADDVGPFNTALHSLEDWNFWCRAVLKGKKFLYNNEPGTEFYVRTHGNNMSGNRYKMWKFKIQARQSLLELALAAQAKSVNPNFDLEPIIVRHQAFLFEEQARFNLLYGDIFTGLRFTGRYFLAGKSNTHIWYDSAYWLKERLLRRNQHNS